MSTNTTTTTTPRRKRISKTSEHYIDNAKFLAEIIKYRQEVAEAEDNDEQRPQIPEYIGECFWKIATRLSYRENFINYSFKDEMILDGIENCIVYFHNYDPDIGKNPFAYFTTIAYNAFVRRINTEEKNRYIIYKNFQHNIIHGMPVNGLDGTVESFHDHHSLFDAGEGKYLINDDLYDNINDFMGNFERKEEEKKERMKNAKKGLQKFYKESPNVAEPKKGGSGEVRATPLSSTKSGK